MGEHYLDDVRLSRSIAAIATATGPGAIGIVRISGADAVDIGSRVFSPSATLLRAPSHTLHFGEVIQNCSGHIDTVLAAVMRAPNTFTGENCVEFHTHGGSIQAESVLRACISAGALPALPGEFTFRRFLNGKIDLTQAESIADLIEAKTTLASRVAMRQHDGVLRGKIVEFLESLLSVRALLEANIDFVEEEIPALERESMLRKMARLISDMSGLAMSFDSGRLLREGARVVLTGAPNVGKSSIFNALVRSDRAIVTDIPGTTRDAVTEQIDLFGIPVILADTAGMRDTNDVVETEGVRRAIAHANCADVVIRVFDNPERFTRGASLGSSSIDVLNKTDLLDEAEQSRVQLEHDRVLLLSAITGCGIEALRVRIKEVLMNHSWSGEDIVITRRRHHDCLLRCREGLERAECALSRRDPLELVAAEVRAATGALEELTGKVYDETILNRIFGEFCIGK